ncbi:MAG TPA: alpha/beta hydrolase [Candidatus Acidoferrales bacterium]|nr:alpha/beta hydrolase [Candidatus Acidoferrales bacterium]
MRLETSGTGGRPKTLDEVKQSLRRRLTEGGNPMRGCDKQAAEEGIQNLQGLDGESWAAAWKPLGDRFAQAAAAAEKAGDENRASALHFQAYAFYYIGRYPCPNHPKKKECAEKARAHFLAAARSFDPPLERIAIPFAGRPGEGKEIVVYLRKPKGARRPSVVVNWGGVDGFKEERLANSNAFLAAGMASVALDMPGTGEAPIYGSADAERLFTPVFEWVRSRGDLDGSRVAAVGSSFGGYWATKVAHTHAEYLKGAVNWGGGVHYVFQPEWTAKSRYADSYLMDLSESRAHALGLSRYEEYAAFAPKMSLLTQGLLDRPCAPLLLIDGKEDTQVPIQDHYLLLEHGNPKTIRVFPGGHMGRSADTLPTVVKWLSQKLRPGP